jgi:hypothetical protein
MRSVIRFFKNVYRFRKALSGYYWADYSGMLQFMGICLKDMSSMMDKEGSESYNIKKKKVAAMQRAAKIIDNHLENRYSEMAQDSFGKKVVIPKFVNGRYESTDKDRDYLLQVALRELELEQYEWDELMEILKGNDKKKILGMKTWWD